MDNIAETSVSSQLYIIIMHFNVLTCCLGSLPCEFNYGYKVMLWINGLILISSITAILPLRYVVTIIHRIVNSHVFKVLGFLLFVFGIGYICISLFTFTVGLMFTVLIYYHLITHSYSDCSSITFYTALIYFSFNFIAIFMLFVCFCCIEMYGFWQKLL